MSEKRNPAIIAGLAGATSLMAPQCAYALPLFDIATGVNSEALAFAVGATSGALLVGAAWGVSALVAARRRRNEAELSAFDFGQPTCVTGAIPSSAVKASEPASVAPSGKHFKAGVTVDAGGEVQTSASHATTDYGQIAENYVAQRSFRERKNRRAEGVAAALAARFGAGMMEGVPVIERADGSVGDVGTSWWTQTVGEARIESNHGYARDEADDVAIPASFSTAAARGKWDPEAMHRPDRSEISQRIAFVDEGVYPEVRAEQDETGDIWKSALARMDENIAADPETPNQDPIGFIDSVGDSETLDEPDNLALKTSYLPFRAPAGHPEVVDTESYIEYLIEDEFARNSSKAARRSSYRFLKMLEGGTQATVSSLRGLTAQLAQAPSGKHFATALAAEA